MFASVSCKHLTTLKVVMCKLFHGSVKLHCHHRQWRCELHTVDNDQAKTLTRCGKVCATHVCASHSTPHFSFNQSFASVIVYDMQPSKHRGLNLALGSKVGRDGENVNICQFWGSKALGGRNSGNCQYSGVGAWKSWNSGISGVQGLGRAKIGYWP